MRATGLCSVNQIKSNGVHLGGLGGVLGNMRLRIQLNVLGDGQLDARCDVLREVQLDELHDVPRIVQAAVRFDVLCSVA